MALDLSLLPLIARGATADVLALDADRVLKRFHRGCSEVVAEREVVAARTAAAAGLPVPAPLDLFRSEGCSCVVFERAQGETLFGSMARDPTTVGDSARLLAELHASIHRHRAPALPSLRERLLSAVGRAPILDADHRARIETRLRSLPERTDLCHGDFHPGQVVMTSRGPMIVDWVDGGRGDAAADVARTALLLSIGRPAEPAAAALLAAARGTFVTEYLRRYLEVNPAVSRDGIAAWTVPITAARSTEGFAHERDELMRIVADPARLLFR